MGTGHRDLMPGTDSHLCSRMGGSILLPGHDRSLGEVPSSDDWLADSSGFPSFLGFYLFPYLAFLPILFPQGIPRSQ